ncbi:MAG: hypothetical protein ACJ72D_24835 [Marmoricola sp.]
MHTMFTPAIARQIVADRVRDAESGRRARLVRGRRSTGQAGNAGSGTSERVVRRAERRAALFTSDIIGAH